jgi:hypothetical protein
MDLLLKKMMTYNGYKTQKGGDGWIYRNVSIDTTIMGEKTYDYLIKHIETFSYP